jgi:hypothetical protein
MNCETLMTRIPAVAAGEVSDSERSVVMNHVESCPDCRAALRGSEALSELRRRKTNLPPSGLFDRIVANATSGSQHQTNTKRFWMGTAFGGAVAASLFAAAIYFGWTGDGPDPAASTAEFVVALGEPRQMNLAFETDRQLDGARISILLSGDIEIEGYGTQRELVWTENLDSGVNRLTLPVLASGLDGGQMVVRMSHPLSEQVFVIHMPTES